MMEIVEKIKKNWKIILIFILGLLIATYPIISNYYYTIDNNNQIAEFNEAVAEMPSKEVLERIELAKA